MRNLIDYIFLRKPQTSLFEFEKDFINHLNIEHLFEYDVLYESHGVFNGCEDLVDFIINYFHDNLENNILYKKKELIFKINDFYTTELKSQGTLIETFKKQILEDRELYTFFETLVLELYLCTEDTINLSYRPQNNYDKNTDKLKECVLVFELPKNVKFNFYSNQVKKLLTHELTHAYEDYNRQRKQNVESLKDILNKNIYTEATKRIKSKNEIKQFIGKFIYLTNKQEQNAYLAEFTTLLKEKCDEIDLKGNIVNQLFNIIKTSETYKVYFDVGSVVESIEHNELDKILPQIAQAYNGVFNSHLTNNKVKSNLINTWYKVKRKFEKQIPKIVYSTMKEMNKLPDKFYF
ncbi:MAG: hypothetical protein ACI4U0_07025 [Candidatus Aphodocola sp.]